MELAAGARVTKVGHRLLWTILASYFLSLIFFPSKGAAAVMALALFAMGPWLVRYDVARLHLKHKGGRLFMAISLLGGYVWISVAGLLAWPAMVQGGLARDAFIHSLFLGFLFSMIFAHATLILPALTGKPMLWHRGFYIHFILLYVSLGIRIAGDLFELPLLREWGAIGNIASLVIFLLNNILAMKLGKDEERARGLIA